MIKKKCALALFWYFDLIPGKFKIEINNILDKIVKALAMNILTGIRERIDECSEIFNKELENIKNT